MREGKQSDIVYFGRETFLKVFDSSYLFLAFSRYSSLVGKIDQAGRPASACNGLYRQKGKIYPGDTGSQPKQLHIRGDI
jgi:hypothetical protein